MQCSAVCVRCVTRDRCVTSDRCVCVWQASVHQTTDARHAGSSCTSTAHVYCRCALGRWCLYTRRGQYISYPDWLVWIIAKSYWLKPFNWTNKFLMAWLLYYLATDSSEQRVHLHSDSQRVIDNVGSVRAHRAQKYILGGVEGVQHWRQVYQSAVGTAAVRHPQSLPQHPRPVRRHSLWYALLVQGPRRAWVTCVHICTNAF